jgi:hypothetical protein
MSFWTLLTGGDRKVKKHGLSGTAVVLSCGNTGIRMRGTRRAGTGAPLYEYHLRVTPQGGAPYEITHRQTFEELESGNLAEVRIDPNDRTNIVIMRRTSDVAGILANGIPGTATVLRHEDVGGVSPRTGHPLEGLALEVRAEDGRPPFEVAFTYGVPPEHRLALRPGAELPVRILANDATGVAIDFDRLE